LRIHDKNYRANNNQNSQRKLGDEPMSEEFVEGTAAGGLTDDATSTGAKSAKMS